LIISISEGAFLLDIRVPHQPNVDHPSLKAPLIAHLERWDLVL
jgi:hypothetical protein